MAALHCEILVFKIALLQSVAFCLWVLIHWSLCRNWAIRLTSLVQLRTVSGAYTDRNVLLLLLSDLWRLSTQNGQRFEIQCEIPTFFLTNFSRWNSRWLASLDCYISLLIEPIIQSAGCAQFEAECDWYLCQSAINNANRKSPALGPDWGNLNSRWDSWLSQNFVYCDEFR